MKVTIRFATVLAICAIIVAFAPKSVQAQSDLGTATKQITDSVTNFKATSFAMDWSLSAKVSGTGTSDGNVTVTGTGAMSYDPTKLNKADLNTISTPGAITFQSTITYNSAMGTTTQKGSAEIRILNGNIYATSDTMNGQWAQIGLADAVSYAKSQAGSMGGTMGGGMATAEAPNAVMMGMMADPDILAAWSKVVATPGFITVSNGADQTIDGASVSNLTITADATKLVASPDLPALIQAVIKFASTMSPSAASSSAQVPTMLAMAQKAVKKGTVTLTWLISKDDQTFRGMGISLDASVDASSMSPNATAPINANMTFTFQLSKVGQPVTVTAPAKSVPVPLGGSSMGSGSMGGGAPGMMPTPPATPAQ